MEKDLNLAVSRFLQQFLEANGVTATITRAEDEGIFDKEGSIRSKKNSDLKNREKLIEKSDADIFISIHMNQFPEEKYKGPQVFFSPNNKESERLANAVQQSMNDTLQVSAPREVKKADGSIYLLKKAKLPAILVECGFMSNREELQKLSDEAYQKQTAWSIYCGMMQYFNEK